MILVGISRIFILFVALKNYTKFMKCMTQNQIEKLLNLKTYSKQESL